MIPRFDELGKIAEWLERNLRPEFDTLVENVEFQKFQWHGDLSTAINTGIFPNRKPVEHGVSVSGGLYGEILMDVLVAKDDVHRNGYLIDVFKDVSIYVVNQAYHHQGGRTKFTEHRDGSTVSFRVAEIYQRYRFNVLMKQEDWPELCDSVRIMNMLKV